MLARVIVSVLVLLQCAPRVAGQDLKQEQAVAKPRDEVPQFGGDRSVAGRINEDRKPKEPVFRFDTIQRGLRPYFDWKDRLAEDYGIAFEFDYSAVYLNASDSPGEDEAASGMARFFGSWTPFGRGTPNTGSLTWKVEHRHRNTDIPPSALGFETGYVGLYEPPFNNDTWRLTNFYWIQKVREGELGLIGGLIDVTDYLDVYMLASPWTGFFNLAFSTGSATIALPGDGGLGFAAGGALGENFYAVAGIADTNADPTQPGDATESFFDDHEYFTHLELGWVPSWDKRYTDNTHLTVWHADERDDAAVPDGWGLNFSHARFYGDKWMPFLRGGYAEDAGSLLEKSVSAGLGYQPTPGQDLIGFGLNWGEPNSDTFGSGLDDQITAELFYRVQLSENFAITPDLQFIVDPALNPDEDSIWVLGMRLRLAL